MIKFSVSWLSTHLRFHFRAQLFQFLSTAFLVPCWNVYSYHAGLPIMFFFSSIWKTEKEIIILKKVFLLQPLNESWLVAEFWNSESWYAGAVITKSVFKFDSKIKGKKGMKTAEGVLHQSGEPNGSFLWTIYSEGLCGLRYSELIVMKT